MSLREMALSSMTSIELNFPSFAYSSPSHMATLIIFLTISYGSEGF